MVQDVRFNNFVFGIALALMLGYVLFIGRPILVPVVTAILIVYVIVGVSKLSGYIPFAGLLGSLLFVLLNVVFLLMEQRRFQQKLGRMSDDPNKTRRLLDVIGEINDRVGRYLAVKTMINIALGVISWLIMVLMGLEFAVFWAIIIALLNYIPYVGSIVGVAFPIALAVIQFDDLNMVLLLLALLIAAQMLMGNIIEPQVMGNSLNLSPYVILISLTAWSSLWGIAGAIFSVPIAAIMVIVFSEFKRTRPLAILLSLNGQIPERGR